MKHWRKDKDTAIMKFYGSIGTWWNGANDFVDTLHEIESSYKNLIIRLHCYGGEVIEGNAIFNALSQSSLNISWQIDGIAASMATIIMLAKGKISMCENAFVMIHVPSAYTEGNAEDHFATGKLLKAMQKNFSNAYSRKTGKSENDVLAWFDGADHWFDANECQRLKLIDEIIPAIDESPIQKPDNGTGVENVFARYKAIHFPNKLKNKNQEMDKQAIIQKFGLSVATDADDAEVLDALAASFKLKDEKINMLSGTIKDNAAAQANLMIEGRAKELNVAFTEEQKTDFKKVAEAAGLATLGTVLNAIKAAPVIKNLIHENGKPEGNAEDRSTWSLATWNEKDPDGLEKLGDSEKEKIYNASFSAK